MSIASQRPRTLRFFGILLTALCIVPLAIILWPIPIHDETFTITSDQLRRTYRLEVEFPAATVVGDGYIVIARLTAVNPEVPEAPSTMGAMQLSSDSMTFDPAGVSSAPFPETKTVTFKWQTVPQRTGDSTMTLFFSRQSRNAATGNLDEQPAWAKSFPVEMRSGFGTWKKPILFFAGCGMVFGILLVLISGIPPRRRRA
jgi:hypothetical protein